MFEIFYDIESSKFREGVILQEYKENFFLVAGGKGRGGLTYKKWAFPQQGDQQAADKAHPIAVKLGMRHEAIETLGKMIDELSGVDTKTTI